MTKEKASQVKQLATALGLAIAMASAITAVASTYFQTRADASEHIMEYIEHKGVNNTHNAEFRAHIESFRDMKSEMQKQTKLQENLHTNLIKLMSRQRVKPEPLEE